MVKIQPKTFFIGKKLNYLPTCHSTNDVASELIQNNNYFEGTVILTDFQSKGKGQRGNTWQSNPKDNLLCSIILKPDFLEIQNQYYLSMAIANSIVLSLNSFGFENTQIKWPNDIYINDKKIGGILIELSISNSKIKSAIIGLGINVFQKIFDNPRATSLINIKPDEEISISAILESICENFETQYNVLKSGNFNTLKKDYTNNLLGYEKNRKFKSNGEIFEGKIINVRESGKICIISGKAILDFDIKEIEFLF